jgi:hypothetical protein
VLWDELTAFASTLQKRLLHGGLPPALLAETKRPAFYREWVDSFFARDIQRLFAFRDMNRFNALFEYLLGQSGGQFEVTNFLAGDWAAGGPGAPQHRFTQSMNSCGSNGLRT